MILVLSPSGIIISFKKGNDMKKIWTLLCVLVILLIGCSREHYNGDEDNYNNNEDVNETEARVYDWENSVMVAQEAFPDINPEFVEGHIVRTIIMDGRVNGIIRMEEIESDIIAIRIFEIESEDALIFHVYFAGSHIEAVVDPKTGMSIYAIE
jgi:hypothetical protein